MFAKQLYRDKVTVWISTISELGFWGVFVISVALLSRSVCALNIKKILKTFEVFLEVH